MSLARARIHLHRKAGLEARPLICVPPWIAKDPRAADPVVGREMHVTVDPEVRSTVQDQIRQVRGVAPSQFGMRIREAGRLRGMVGHDHDRAVVCGRPSSVPMKARVVRCMASTSLGSILFRDRGPVLMRR